MGKYNISFPLGSIDNTINFSPNTIENIAIMEDISTVIKMRTQPVENSIVVATSNAEGVFTYNGVQLNICGYIGAQSPIEYNKDLALGNGYYYLDTEGHLTIDGNGELMYGIALPWIDNEHKEAVEICTIKDTINASNLSYYFYNAINLNTISNIPISAVNIQSMFENCSNIQNIPVIPSEVLNITNAFKGCIDLSGYQNLLADPTDYSGCYENAAVNDTGLFVDFDSNIGSKIDLIIDTKSENSNIHRALKLTQDIELPNVTTDDAKGTQFELNINKNVVPTNYTWYKNEEVIEGVNSKILNVANPDYWIDNNSVYKCKAVDMFENELSTEGTLTIEPLGIENVVINNAAECYDLGEVTLNAEVVGGTSGYTYQWYKNDIEITGETQLSIVIKNLQYADSNKDNYSCKVTNIKNTVESNNCTINILPNPVVVADLEQLRLKTHTNGTLNVTRISGTLPFTYEWYKDDILIENENNNSLELTDVAFSLNESEIKCKVTNPSGSVFTNVSTLNIYELLKSVTLDESRELNDYEVITLKPTITSVNGNENNTYVYQWYKNNVAIPDETEETYVITNMYYKDYNDTNFACRVSLADDSEDTILSNNCNITFIIEELVLNEITLDTLSVGDTMELECSYSQGNERYNYVWYENNVEIKNGIDENILTKQITSDMYKNTYHCVVEGVFTKISNTVTLDLDLFVSEIYSVLDDGEIYSNVVYIEPNKESKFTIKADGGIKPYSYSWNLSQTANGLSGPYLADLNSENCSILLNFEECKQFEESSYNYFICKVEDSIPHAQWSNIAIKYAFECQTKDLSLDYTYKDVLHVSPDIIGLNSDSETTYKWYSIDDSNTETLIHTSQTDDFSIDYVTNPIGFGAQAERYKCVITNDGNTCSDEFTISYGLSMGVSVENAGEQYDSNKVYDNSVVCSIIPVDETVSEENMRYNIEVKGDGGTYGGINYTVDNTSDIPVLTFEDNLPWYDIKDKIVSVEIGENVITPNISGWFHDCTNLKTIQGEIPSSVINMNATFANCTNLEIGKVKTTGELTMNYAFLNCSELTMVSLISEGMLSAKDAFVGCNKLNEANITPTTFLIKCNAGRFIGSWGDDNGPSGRVWTLPPGSTSNRADLPDTVISYNKETDVSILNDNSVVKLSSSTWKGDYTLELTNSDSIAIDLSELPPITYSLYIYGATSITGDLSDLPELTYDLDASQCELITGDLSNLPKLNDSLNLNYCKNITGDLSDLPQLNGSLELNYCQNITGDLSDLPNLHNILNLNYCKNITGNLSNLPQLDHFLDLSRCSLVTGAYSNVSGENVPLNTFIDYTNLSATDIDNTLIAYAACTKEHGWFGANGMERTSMSDDAVAALTNRSWTISGITKI